MALDPSSFPRRLECFLADWKAARAAEPLGLLAERLGQFFTSLHTLSSPEDVAAHSAGVLQPAALHSVFAALRTPLAEATAMGAFFNPWTAAGLKRDEVRNAAVLASLLDPHLCPETGPRFLWHMLSNFQSDAGHLPSIQDLRRGYTVRTEDCPLGGGENRVDVTVEGSGFLLFIEVKIDAGEGNLQLGRYDGVLRSKAALLGGRALLVYLSPRAPASLPPDAVHLTWLDVANAAREAGRARERGKPSMVETLLLQFATHVMNFKGNTNGPARARPAADQQFG